MQAKLLLLSLLVCKDCAAYSQDSGAKLFRGASHCLVTEKQDWLAVQKAVSKTLEFGFVIDPKSGPGGNHIYVVAYTNPDRSKGRVFDLRYQQKADSTLFDVQNNASFVKSGTGIAFDDPPLGGTWTQTQLLSAIKQIEHSASIRLNIVDLTAPYPDVSCNSYVGNK